MLQVIFKDEENFLSTLIGARTVYSKLDEVEKELLDVKDTVHVHVMLSDEESSAVLETLKDQFNLIGEKLASVRQNTNGLNSALQRASSKASTTDKGMATPSTS